MVQVLSAVIRSDFVPERYGGIITLSFVRNNIRGGSRMVFLCNRL